MNFDNTIETNTVLEDVTRTLLYEGYALYPYHRSAIKNQKPIPFGVVFPQSYHRANPEAHSIVQSQTIVTGSEKQLIDIRVRFLQLIKNSLFEYSTNHKVYDDGFVPVQSLNINKQSYQAGWQTIEHTINTGHLTIKGLLKKTVEIPFQFNKIFNTDNVYNEAGEVVGSQTESIAPLAGWVRVKAEALDSPGAFRITVMVSNSTPVEEAAHLSRDQVFTQSLLSAHIILHAPGGHFISQQNPGEKWKSIIEECTNENTWPILIDETDTIMLSSPIILYDYPQINPQSAGDLFDSTEIEEALLLHVNLLSEEEKKSIGEKDEKLKAMLAKVGQLTPEEMMRFHSSLKNNVPKNKTKHSDHESSQSNG